MPGCTASASVTSCNECADRATDDRLTSCRLALLEMALARKVMPVQKTIEDMLVKYLYHCDGDTV